MTLLCSLDEITDGEARGFEINEQKLVAVKHRGELYVYHNNCPHRSIPLEWMPDQFLDFDKNFIQCSTHGALFRIEDGECIAGPCIGDRLDTIPHRIEADQVYIELPGAMTQK
ncbi:Rieske (2Fe-2S) protein [Marinobacterium jannaschii]|uniref:Rieske (2Fe-2S) protein n=1 Tax=Marinobacterium jannaschii TaxID=64970 RepID=UPI00047F0E07|nr:Rieske (2Fe-2S) protein [Marinobacterium jannaschii]